MSILTLRENKKKWHRKMSFFSELNFEACVRIFYNLVHIFQVISRNFLHEFYKLSGKTHE